MHTRTPSNRTQNNRRRTGEGGGGIGMRELNNRNLERADRAVMQSAPSWAACKLSAADTDSVTPKLLTAAARLAAVSRPAAESCLTKPPQSVRSSGAHAPSSRSSRTTWAGQMSRRSSRDKQRGGKMRSTRPRGKVHTSAPLSLTPVRHPPYPDASLRRRAPSAAQLNSTWAPCGP